MKRLNFADEFERKLRQTGRPATTVIISLMALSYVLAWFTKSHFFYEGIGFITWSRPWTALTYPFASSGEPTGFIYLLFELWWLWQIGGEVESTVGTLRYVVFFLAVALLGAVGISIGHLVIGAGLSGLVPLFSPLIPIGAVTVAWGSRSPGARVNLYGIIPITAMWIAWIFAGIIFFAYGAGAPIMGLFALLPLGFAWLFATNRIPSVPYSGVVVEKRREAKVDRAKAIAFDNEVRNRKQEREERERLRKLFEGSLEDK